MPLPRAGHPTARAVKASAPLKTAARRPLVVVVAATPNYLRQASQNLGKYTYSPPQLRRAIPYLYVNNNALPNVSHVSLSLPRPCRTSVSALRSPVSLGVRLEPREASYQLHGSWGGLCVERSRLRVPAALAPASLMSRARIHTAAPHNRSSTLGHPRVPVADRPDAFEGRCSTGPANAHVRNADHPAQPHGFGTTTQTLWHAGRNPTD